MRDLANNIGVQQALPPAVYSASESLPPVIDLLGFGSAAVVLCTGAIVGDGDFTPKLQESDEGTSSPGTFEDVAADEMIGSLPDTLAADSVVKVGYIGNKRYVRVLLTKNGGTSIALAATVIKGRANDRPVS